MLRKVELIVIFNNKDNNKQKEIIINWSLSGFLRQRMSMLHLHIVRNVYIYTLI